MKSIGSLRSNRGFSTLAFAEQLSDLPKECSLIIELEGTRGSMYDPRDSTGARVAFKPDVSLDASNATLFSQRLAAVKLDEAANVDALPTSIGFLEMFEAGRVEHLNVLARWAESEPSRSLAVPVGVDAQGLPMLLDAHEDAHGPHGLFAGMTGSGKSEFLITYILSLAACYRPDEVSFVLIDYKGGGLAGAFDSPHARLPHLAGTITNLDGPAIARTLISIQSELRRRQALFNAARDRISAGTMDIYRYQELYRSGVADEPCPHLFIVADEFAELKDQQPDFMEQLISAARIGRSLGVHLLLATQKPSGVVNDQIWSNARFKVCLKVADAADSREMIKTTDAAEISAAGRFYMLVGYNEYYAVGQSAYTGIAYRPKDHFQRRRDDSAVMISSTGRPLAAASPPKQDTQGPGVPESVAVLGHLAEVAEAAGIQAPRLWLDAIPDDLDFDRLFERYPEAKAAADRSVLEPAIGELDDPFDQSQRLLRLPLTEDGNALVYGAAGSGKAALLTAMLLSLVRCHSAQDLNIYIVDFGAETLGAFAQAPQVGDVVFTGDEEKTVNLLKMLSTEIDTRRRLLSAFGGSLKRFNDSAVPDGRMPSIVVAINNYDVFAELYSQHVDELTRLTRDGVRYGIYFVLACTRTGSVSHRMQPNFKQKLALNMNDSSEYINAFGTARGIVIPDAYARGLVKSDKIYEFQTALLGIREGLSEFDAITEAVRALGGRTAMVAEATAKPIPTLPDEVTAEFLTADGVTWRSVPVGIARDTIEVVKQDFTRQPVSFVLSNDEDRIHRFIEPYLQVLQAIEGSRLTVFDPESIISPGVIQRGRHVHLRGDEAIQDYLVNRLHKSVYDSHDILAIISMKAFMDMPDTAARDKMVEFLTGISSRSLGGLVITGNPARFASFSYQDWFKGLCQQCSGVWLDANPKDSSFLQTTRLYPTPKEAGEESFGWFVRNGIAATIKHATTSANRSSES